MAVEPTGEQRDQWGNIMRLHQPDGFDTTLAAMSDDEFSSYEDRMESEEHYVKFAEWSTDR